MRERERVRERERERAGIANADTEASAARALESSSSRIATATREQATRGCSHRAGAALTEPGLLSQSRGCSHTLSSACESSPLRIATATRAAGGPWRPPRPVRVGLGSDSDRSGSVVRRARVRRPPRDSRDPKAQRASESGRPRPYTFIHFKFDCCPSRFAGGPGPGERLSQARRLSS